MNYISKDDLRERLNFYGLEHRSHAFAAIADLLERHADEALDFFYAKLSTNSTTSNFFASQSMKDGALTAQKSHWLRMFGEGLNEDYQERAIRIGNTHARIGLDPQWYIGGYAMILEQVIGQAIAGGAKGALPGRKKLARTVTTLIKVALLDMDLALSTYFVKAEENVRTTVVNRIGDALAAISAGDLTAHIDDLPPSYAKLQGDFNAAVKKLHDTIESVANGAHSITNGAGEIRSASDDLSRRTEEQAAQLEESAAAMNRLTGAISETSKSIAGLNGSVNLTHKEALKGGEVVEAAMHAMDDIQKSSDSIAHIIKIIDDIAFQTNLLALNAGVEAARVGDLGKGFAVVASEVRALAQRSSEAAEQIKNLIGESRGQVEDGVRQVRDTGKVLQTILAQISEIASAAEQISDSTAAQSNNLRQINHAVAEMDQVTQKNAAMVEEATAAARTMAGEAETLSQTVSQFRVSSPSTNGPRVTAMKKAKAAPPAVRGNLAVAHDDKDWSEF